MRIIPNFRNDYSEIAHPAILARLLESALDKNVGYGMDEVCGRAEAKIKRKLTCDDVDVHFLVGGTSANLIALSAFLRPHEAIICAASAHVNAHETGAIEAKGHKLIYMDTRDGKLTRGLIEETFAEYQGEHMVKPKLVFIANATELGTHYSLAELTALYAACVKLGLYLYIDGARLGSAMAASDVRFSDLCGVCDAFYIGGTKNGAPIGEALIIVNPSLKNDFRYFEKQCGGMLAKGFILGHVFDVLLDGDLYMSLARHANNQSDKLRAILAERGARFAYQTKTNQTFILVSHEKANTWVERAACQTSERRGSDTVLRFVTSFATSDEEIEAFRELIREL